MRLLLIIERTPANLWRWRFDDADSRTPVTIGTGEFKTTREAIHQAGDFAESIRVVWPAVRVDHVSPSQFPASECGV